MHGNRRNIGRGVILAGILVIAALILPAGFWWFALGVTLIVVGAKICRNSRR